MPFETNSATNVDDLATKLVTFATSNGWTQNGTTVTQGTGKKFHLSKNNTYLNFRTFNGETPSMSATTTDCRSQTGSMLMTLSTGYNGANSWYNQTNTGVYGGSNQTQTCGIGQFSGSIPAYYFFSFSGTGYDVLYVVTEAPAGEYSFLLMGMLDKNKYGGDSAPIGMFATGTGSHALSSRAKPITFFTSANMNSAWGADIPASILNASVATSFSGYAYRTKGDFASSLTTTTPSPIDSTASYRSTMLNLPNSFSSTSPMFPVIVGCNETSGNYWVPFGELPNVYLTNIGGFNAGDTVTISSTTYKIFPFLRKDSTNNVGQSLYANFSSGNLAYAIKY